MSISERQMNLLKKYCRDHIESIRGYEEALRSTGRYECHHINELTFTKDELIKQNMYYNRPASELVLMTKSEHSKLHRRHGMPSAVHGERHGRYKDGRALICSEYHIALKNFRRGLISEEELHVARAKWREEQRIERRNRALQKATNQSSLTM